MTAAVNRLLLRAWCAAPSRWFRQAYCLLQNANVCVAWARWFRKEEGQ